MKTATVILTQPEKQVLDHLATCKELEITVCRQGLKEALGSRELPMTIELALTPLEQGIEFAGCTCGCAHYFTTKSGDVLLLNARQRLNLLELVDAPSDMSLSGFWVRRVV